MNQFKPAIIPALIVSAIIGIAYVISILPQPMIWAAATLLIVSLIYQARRSR